MEVTRNLEKKCLRLIKLQVTGLDNTPDQLSIQKDKTYLNVFKIVIFTIHLQPQYP